MRFILLFVARVKGQPPTPGIEPGPAKIYSNFHFIFSGDEYVPSGNTTVVGGDINPAGSGGYYPYGQPTFLVEDQDESSSLNVLN